MKKYLLPLIVLALITGISCQAKTTKSTEDEVKKAFLFTLGIKREEDRKKVMQSGLLAALNAPDDAASNVLGPGGLGIGINKPGTGS